MVAGWVMVVFTSPRLAVMDSRPMGVAVQHQGNTGIAQRLRNRVAVDVHDVFTDRSTAGHTRGTCLCSEGEAFFQRLLQHHRLPVRIPRHLAYGLILDVIRAIGIAVTEQNTVAMDFHDRRVFQDGDAGFFGKSISDHEVTIAMHEKHGHVFPCQLAERLLDPGVVLIRIVVADPGFEQVAQDVEFVRVQCFSFQELQELICYLRTVRFEVQVRDEEYGHSKVYRDAWFTMIGICGTSCEKLPCGPVGALAILSTTSMPWMTLPKTA